jgi:serine/threonine protein kinase
MAAALLPGPLWDLVEPLLPLPPRRPQGGRPRVSDRACLTGIVFVLRSGIPWQMLPQELGCGSGMTCWRRLRDWQLAGVWDLIHFALLDWLARGRWRSRCCLSVAGDADRLARFQREAEVLAVLNHPNIAAIYGFERSSDLTALVMELVEGEDLSQRIARGAMPLDEALPIAKQIAEALEAAHEQGIIHRDLKPANINVRSDGTVKVLDFGLAKAIDAGGAGQAGGAGNLSMSPTMLSPALVSGVGVILGTAAYMAPEQARGKVVDKRADIWAFGAVLFEMLTGQRAFPGEDGTDTLAAIVRVEPNWTLLPPSLSSTLVTFITRCLHKDPRQRIPDMPRTDGIFAIRCSRPMTNARAIALVSTFVTRARGGRSGGRRWISPGVPDRSGVPFTGTVTPTKN